MRYMDLEGWMDGLVLYILFNSISVKSGRWKGEHEGLCAMKRRLELERISPSVGFQPVTLCSEVWSAKCSAKWMLHWKENSELSVEKSKLCLQMSISI